MSERPGTDRDSPDNLAKLERRITAARKASEPKPRGDKEKFAAASMAWRVLFELIASIGIGAAMGWGLDWLFDSLPLFLIVFALLGCAAGFRTIMRSATEMQRKQVAKAAKEDEEHGNGR